jgi:hypothetical protein
MVLNVVNETKGEEGIFDHIVLCSDQGIEHVVKWVQGEGTGDKPRLVRFTSDYNTDEPGDDGDDQGKASDVNAR